MNISHDKYVVTIEFDNPWEKETFDWIIETQTLYFFRKHLLKLLEGRFEARKYIDISEEYERAINNRPDFVAARAKRIAASGTERDDSTNAGGVREEIK